MTESLDLRLDALNRKDDGMDPNEYLAEPSEDDLPDVLDSTLLIPVDPA